MNTYSEYGTQAASIEAQQQHEGPLARAIEKRTARIPSDFFLWAAGAAMLGSLAAQAIGMRRPARGLMRRREMGRAPLASFIGMWVPSLLLLGVYNKIVKVAGSDRMHR